MQLILRPPLNASPWGGGGTLWLTPLTMLGNCSETAFERRKAGEVHSSGGRGAGMEGK